MKATCKITITRNGAVHSKIEHLEENTKFDDDKVLALLQEYIELFDPQMKDKWSYTADYYNEAGKVRVTYQKTFCEPTPFVAKSHFYNPMSKDRYKLPDDLSGTRIEFDEKKLQEFYDQELEDVKEFAKTGKYPLHAQKGTDK